jgi:uncharacterized protein (UPF0332 family)
LTIDEAKKEVTRYWSEKARAALESAKAELAAGRTDFAVNRAYYACFYSASVLLLRDGHKFGKHSAVRAALHRNYVKPGVLDARWGRLFDRLFDSRQRGDYEELVEFDPADVAQMVTSASQFVEELLRLAGVKGVTG